MKKILSIFLSAVFIFAFSVNGYAIPEYIPSYSEYIQYVEEGILGEDVSFSEWSEMVKRSRKNIEAIKDSNMFKLVYAGPSRSLNNITLQSGDVVLTDDPSTASGGNIGHSGIAVASNKILHIAGTGYTPSYIYLNEWLNNKYANGYTYVYRCNSSSIGANAATWGVNNYGASNAPYHNATYQITTAITSFNPTYCSKIVWQCYYYGAGASYAVVPVTGLIAPFDLPQYISSLNVYSII